MLIKYVLLHCLFYALDVKKKKKKKNAVVLIPDSDQYKTSLSATWLRTGDLQESFM